MTFRIGVDFDNTIACYEHVFAYGAQSKGFVLDNVILSKSIIKEKILSNNDGDINWQKLQGQIYGKFMHKASVFPGFAEFLLLAKLRGHEVYIVSHKTEFGHFDEERISLPAEAIKWLVSNNFIGQKSSPIKKENVFFEPTRELKIERITSLGCTHFIDDLEEVLDEPAFPDKTNKYLFNSNNKAGLTKLKYPDGAWRSITNQIFSDWTEVDIVLGIQYVFPELHIKEAILTKGRGNSRIYKLYATTGKTYALKIYPDLQWDTRKRLETEFSACQILGEAGYPVVEAIAKNTSLNWAVYSWIDGVIETPNERFVNTSVDFIKNLMVFSCTSKNTKIFSNASEACLCGLEIVTQIQNRFDRLINTEYKDLINYLKEDFLPVFNNAIKFAKDLLKDGFDKTIDSNLLIMSPSDFGAHNAIINKNGQTYFIDFEYFGWDDPVKLTCDFYWHPGMNLNKELQILWMKQIKTIFVTDINFETRVTAYLPLFGLRWCLILLNEFLKDKIVQRIHADYEKRNNIEKMQDMQFNKSKNILEIIKTKLNHG